MKEHISTIVLTLILLILSAASLFVGVIDLSPASLLSGSLHQLEVFLISRLPRLLAILCTGAGMSAAGLIMQQLCMNKFVSPTTGATISSAQLGILFALLFLPSSTISGAARFFPSAQPFWEPGSLSGLSNKSSLRIPSWFRSWASCSETSFPA